MCRFILFGSHKRRQTTLDNGSSAYAPWENDDNNVPRVPWCNLCVRTSLYAQRYAAVDTSRSNERINFFQYYNRAIEVILNIFRGLIQSIQICTRENIFFQSRSSFFRIMLTESWWRYFYIYLMTFGFWKYMRNTICVKGNFAIVRFLRCVDFSEEN